MDPEDHHDSPQLHFLAGAFAGTFNMWIVAFHILFLDHEIGSIVLAAAIYTWMPFMRTSKRAGG